MGKPRGWGAVREGLETPRWVDVQGRDPCPPILLGSAEKKAPQQRSLDPRAHSDQEGGQF